MGKYKDCYRSDNGRTYCWNDLIRKWVLMPDGKEEIIETKDVPTDVLDAAAHKLALRTRFEE